MQKAFCLALARSYGLAWLQLLDLKNSRLPFWAWHFIYFFKGSPEEQSSATNRAVALSLIGVSRSSDNRSFPRACLTARAAPATTKPCPALEVAVLQNATTEGLHPWKNPTECLLRMSVLCMHMYNSHLGEGHWNPALPPLTSSVCCWEKHTSLKLEVFLMYSESNITKNVFSCVLPTSYSLESQKMTNKSSVSVRLGVVFEAGCSCPAPGCSSVPARAPRAGSRLIPTPEALCWNMFRELQGCWYEVDHSSAGNVNQGD